MKIVEKIKAKQKSLINNAPVTVAFLGDSVTQGCFECYKNEAGSVDTVFDYSSAYSTRFREIMAKLYPRVQINVINSGISGDSAPSGLERLERDVLAYKPDLVVVSYGLNDSMGGMEGIERYRNALSMIFERIISYGAEVVFLTQNYMNDYTSCHLGTDEAFVAVAERCAKVQKEGVLARYFDTARDVANKYGVRVCDVYRSWELLSAAGVNTTELLANKLNHPTRDMHLYVAIKLIEEILK